jgi:hypothetical protein
MSRQNVIKAFDDIRQVGFATAVTEILEYAEKRINADPQITARQLLTDLRRKFTKKDDRDPNAVYSDAGE